MALNDIDTFIIVMLENRSFDHMLGYLSLPDANPPMPVEGLQSNPVWLQAHANNDPRPNRPPVAPTLLSPQVQAIADPPHDSAAIAQQINSPPQSGPPAKMGGFVSAYVPMNPTDPSRVMGYYKAAGVPTFDFFARNFVVCDNWFTPLPTGTQPNRLMALSGTSRIKDNATLTLPLQQLVYDWLNTNSIPWCSYQWAGFPFITLMAEWAPSVVGSLNDFFSLGPFRWYEHFHEQWNANQTPSVIFIEPKYTDDKISWAAPNDDHPPTGIAKGQDFLKEIYRTLTSNPSRWAKTMMIVTYDEHGGFFDHVEPLPVSATAGGFQFGSTGPRVPALIVSPQVAPATVFRNKLDHTSILRLLAERFTPGVPFSPEVAARQQHFDSLSAVLMPAAPAQPRVPAMPPGMRALTHVLSATAPVPPMGPFAPRDTETAKAYDHMAHELARKHPDLLTGPAGEAIASYVARAPQPGDDTALAALTSAAAVPRKRTAKAKPKAKFNKPKSKPRRKTKTPKRARKQKRRKPRG